MLALAVRSLTLLRLDPSCYLPLEIVVEQSVGAIILVGIMQVDEHRHELTEKCCLTLGQGKCDVVLVDRDGLPHRLVQLVPLIVSADEVVRRRERVPLLEGLNYEVPIPSSSLQQARAP